MERDSKESLRAVSASTAIGVSITGIARIQSRWKMVSMSLPEIMGAASRVRSL